MSLFLLEINSGWKNILIWFDRTFFSSIFFMSIHFFSIFFQLNVFLRLWFSTVCINCSDTLSIQTFLSIRSSPWMTFQRIHQKFIVWKIKHISKIWIRVSLKVVQMFEIVLQKGRNGNNGQVGRDVKILSVLYFHPLLCKKNLPLPTFIQWICQGEEVQKTVHAV